MINAIDFHSETQLADLLTSLGFDSSPLTPGDWIRCPVDDKEAIGRRINYLVVAVCHQAFYVLYYDEMDAMYAFWDLLKGDVSETSLRKMILTAQSPAVMERMDENIRSTFIAHKLAEHLGQYVERRNLGWLWQGDVAVKSGSLAAPIYQVETVFVSKERLQRIPFNLLEVAP
jgi:hypothetical protein